MPLRRELTPKEQREALNVPSLDGDNAFTGTNTFSGTMLAAAVQSDTLGNDNDLTLTTVDTVTVARGDDAVLDFSLLGADRTFTFPDASGVLALIGDPVTLPYVAKSGTYTLQASDAIMEATSGTFTTTLPTAVGVTGRLYVVKNSGAGVVTVDTTSGQTIDGAASASVAAGAVLRVASNGANWITL